MSSLWVVCLADVVQMNTGRSTWTTLRELDLARAASLANSYSALSSSRYSGSIAPHPGIPPCADRHRSNRTTKGRA